MLRQLSIEEAFRRSMLHLHWERWLARCIPGFSGSALAAFAVCMTDHPPSGEAIEDFLLWFHLLAHSEPAHEPPVGSGASSLWLLCPGLNVFMAELELQFGMTPLGYRLFDMLFRALDLPCGELVGEDDYTFDGAWTVIFDALDRRG